MKFFIGLKNACLPTVFLWAVIILILTQCACGVSAQTPTYQAPHIAQTDIPMATVPHVTAVSTNVEKVHTDAHVYTTTAPLHIRSCAGIDCDVLTYLAAGVSVDVMAAGIPGPGCAGASWYAVQAGGVAGFVCSLYIKESK